MPNEVLPSPVIESAPAGRYDLIKIERASGGQTGNRLKIATFNVNGVNGRLPVLLRWLEEYKPDVACLQELKAPQEKFPAAAIRQAGYGAIWHGQKSWNGVAILARGLDPIESRRGLPGDPDDIHSSYIEARVGAFWLAACIFPTATQRPVPSSIANSVGSSV